MDEIRNQLKIMNRQFDFYMKHKTAMKNNLIASLTKLIPVQIPILIVLPGRTEARSGLILLPPIGMWIVFANCRLTHLLTTIKKWCKRRKYNFSQSKAVEIYEASKEIVSVLPKDDLTKLIVKQAVEQLNMASQTVEQLRAMMNEAASKLPEYPIVMAMKVSVDHSVPSLWLRLVMFPASLTKGLSPPSLALTPA